MQPTSADSKPGVSNLSRRPRILIVDDDPLIQDSLVRLIKAQDYEAVAAGNGRQALDAVDRMQFDVILLDLNMPGIGGVDVLAELSKRGVATPVIVVSGDNAIDSAVIALRQGAADFIRKPYKPEELLKRIGNTISNQQLERENSLIQQRLQQSEKWHRFLVNTSPDFIYTLDGEGRFTFVNDRVESLLGFTRSELVGRHFSEIIFEEDLFRAEHVFNERRADARASRNVELRLKCKDGQQRPRVMNGRYRTVEVTATGMYEFPETRFENRFVGTYGVVKDISDRKQAEETVHYQTFHDLLTGLPNRAKFRDHLGRALVYGKRKQQALSVMILDLDNFRVVNDSLGHGVGDELLIHIATRLRQCLADDDILARLGGDEFAVLLEQVDENAARHMAGRILRLLDQPFEVAGQSLYVAGSIGLALYPQHAHTPQELSRRADVAMYVAKREKNGIALYDPAQDHYTLQRLAQASDLRSAISNENLLLHFQPQIDLHTGKYSGVEALLRWHHPQLGYISPDDFIPVAEQTGLIRHLTYWVLDHSLAQIAAWQHQALPRGSIAVNLSAYNLQDAGLALEVARLLKKWGVQPWRLVLEITESSMMANPARALATLEKLNDIGVQIAIDDFGTGFSSLSYLKQLPVDKLKIDKSFVMHMNEDDNDAMIVRSTIDLAHNLGLEVVAEGVESAAALELLHILNCDAAQGYFISRPLPAAELAKWLATSDYCQGYQQAPEPDAPAPDLPTTH